MKRPFIVQRRTFVRKSRASASYGYHVPSNAMDRYYRRVDDSRSAGSADDHDAAGNPAGVLESGGDRVTWTYDATSRLTREQRSGEWAYDHTYAYDALGNRLVKDATGALTTSTYDLANQLVTSEDANGVTTHTYDLAGNLHIVEQPTGQRTTTTWDDQNRQTGVLLPDGSAVTNTSRFDGLRYSKQEPQATTKFLWDVTKYLAETNAADEIQAVYTNEPQPYGQCAGCVNKQVVTTLGSWPVGPQSNIFDPEPINVQLGGGLMVTLPGFASEANILKCCRQKGTSGRLDIAIENTAPNGEGIPIISIPPNPSR